MGFALGLDIGIASVGWCLLNSDKKRIEALGVRIFDAAENPKTGDSLAAPRRIARLARRRLRRRRGRLNRILGLFEAHGLISNHEWRQRNENHSWEKDPYTLRAEALDRLLSGPEFAKSLYHLAKKRGFKSSKRGIGGEKDAQRKKEEGELLKGVSGMNQALNEGGWRTVGEMLAKSPEFKEKKRNNPASYQHTVARDDLYKEVEKLFKAQRNLGSRYAVEELENAFLDEMIWQKGPESGDALLDKVGSCQFFRDEKRAPVATFSHEKFVLLGKLINMRWTDNNGEHGIPPERLSEIIAFALDKKEINQSHIRFLLGLAESASFRGVDYRVRNKGDDHLPDSNAVRKQAENKPFFKWRFFWDLRKAIQENLGKEAWGLLAADTSKLDDIGFILTVYKSDTEIREKFAEKKFDPRVIEALVDAGLAPDKFGGLSLKAIRLLLPEMEHGKRYDEACATAGIHHSLKQKKTDWSKLPPIPYDEIRNPVVMRALSQCRKVVNAIIARYGKPERICVEMARDMSRSREERDKLDRENKDRNVEYEREKVRFEEGFGRPPRKDEFLKWRLYHEQHGRCAYSDAPLDLNRLSEDGYCQIDHILPWSRSFDDSQLNKALVLGYVNQEKRNQTPFEYLGGASDSREWNDFRIRIQTSHLPKSKKDRLLRMHLDAKASEEFRERNLNDTRYSTRFFAEFVEQNLGVRVIRPTGKLTGFLRKRWGLRKDREESHLHHAQDAAVTAASSQAMIQAAAKYSQWKELGKIGSGYVVNEKTGEVKDRFPEPWDGFRSEVQARLQMDEKKFYEEIATLGYDEEFRKNLKPVFPSFAPRHKVTGEAHPATIISKRSLREEFSVKKVPLSDLKLNGNGELDLFDKEHNQALHDALVSCLLDHGGDAKKAFKKEFRKPTRDGSQGPLVRSVKVIGKREPSLWEVRGGMSGKGGLIRCDIFRKKDKFWIVPIYVSDTKKGELPNRAIVAYKPESEWEVMGSEARFLFSLQPNDLVEVVDRSGKRYIGYYSSCDRGTGTISLKSPWVPSGGERPGIKTVKSVAKFAVEPLGECHAVGGEIRRPIKIRYNPPKIRRPRPGASPNSGGVLAA